MLKQTLSFQFMILAHLQLASTASWDGPYVFDKTKAEDIIDLSAFGNHTFQPVNVTISTLIIYERPYTFQRWTESHHCVRSVWAWEHRCDYRKQVNLVLPKLDEAKKWITSMKAPVWEALGDCDYDHRLYRQDCQERARAIPFANQLCKEVSCMVGGWGDDLPHMCGIGQQNCRISTKAQLSRLNNKTMTFDGYEAVFIDHKAKKHPLNNETDEFFIVDDYSVLIPRGSFELKHLEGTVMCIVAPMKEPSGKSSAKHRLAGGAFVQYLCDVNGTTVDLSDGVAFTENGIMTLIGDHTPTKDTVLSRFNQYMEHYVTEPSLGDLEKLIHAFVFEQDQTEAQFSRVLDGLTQAMDIIQQIVLHFMEKDPTFLGKIMSRKVTTTVEHDGHSFYIMDDKEKGRSKRSTLFAEEKKHLSLFKFPTLKLKPGIIDPKIEESYLSQEAMRKRLDNLYDTSGTGTSIIDTVSRMIENHNPSWYEYIIEPIIKVYTIIGATGGLIFLVRKLVSASTTAAQMYYGVPRR